MSVEERREGEPNIGARPHPGGPGAGRRLPSSEPFVEIFRLLVVVLLMGIGLQVGGGGGDEVAGFLGAALGACTGYVLGGLLGRGARRAMGQVEATVDRIPASTLLAGALGALLAGGLGVLGGVVAVVLVPSPWGWPVLGLLAWVGVYAGFQAGARKGEELVSLLHRPAAPGPPLRSAPLEPLRPTAPPGVLVDSSAAIDGRLLAVVDSGFLPGDLVVPRFVLDELQGLADAQDPRRRRLGRRALELLDLIGSDRDRLDIVDDEIPELADVEAKLVSLARRNGHRILTVDSGLQRVAELQGVTCLNLHRLAESLRPVLVPGETIRLPIVREGREPGQGVGFLDDGTMVVVTDAAALVGEEIDVVVASSVQTPRGRMFFAALPEA